MGLIHKTKLKDDIMFGIFNKNFFGFLSGFLGLIFVGLIFVFMAGYYKSDKVENGKNLEAKTPIQQVKIDDSLNSKAVRKSIQYASSTDKVGK